MIANKLCAVQVVYRDRMYSDIEKISTNFSKLLKSSKVTLLLFQKPPFWFPDHSISGTTKDGEE